MIPDPTLNAAGPLRKKKSPSICFGSGALSQAGTALQGSPFGPSPCCLSTPGDVDFGSFLGSQLPQAALCQDLDFDYTLSLPVATGIKCLFPSPDLAGFQDTNPDCRSNRKR